MAATARRSSTGYAYHIAAPVGRVPIDDGQPNTVSGARSGQCAAPGF
jgi:hypothetical protein